MCPWWNWIPLEPPTLPVRVRAPADTPKLTLISHDFSVNFSFYDIKYRIYNVDMKIYFFQSVNFYGGKYGYEVFLLRENIKNPLM